jgi:HSP20 family protein
MRLYDASRVRRLGELRREMDRLFADWDRPRPAAFPPVNILAHEAGLVVTAELPGVAPADLEISAIRDGLTIRGTLPEPEAEEGRTWHRRERRSGSFSRTIQLPYAIDAESVDATCRDGVLRIALARPEQDKPRRIPVQTA